MKDVKGLNKAISSVKSGDATVQDLDAVCDAAAKVVVFYNMLNFKTMLGKLREWVEDTINAIFFIGMGLLIFIILLLGTIRFVEVIVK